MQRSGFAFVTTFLFWNLVTEPTCSFPVPRGDQVLVQFFSWIPLSQLLPVEPDQQHPVAVLLIAVLTCEQTQEVQ